MKHKTFLIQPVSFSTRHTRFRCTTILTVRKMPIRGNGLNSTRLLPLVCSGGEENRVELTSLTARVFFVSHAKYRTKYRNRFRQRRDTVKKCRIAGKQIALRYHAVEPLFHLLFFFSGPNASYCLTGAPLKFNPPQFCPCELTDFH